MKGYTSNEAIPARAQAILKTVARAVELLPERPTLRCHELTRAVAVWLHTLGEHTKAIDGHFQIVEHSWLYMPDYRCVLDVYAIGRLPLVQLVSAEVVLGVLINSYKGGAEREDIDKQMVARLVIELDATTTLRERFWR